MIIRSFVNENEIRLQPMFAKYSVLFSNNVKISQKKFRIKVIQKNSYKCHL